MRHAVYYAPDPASLLHARASAFLGRDAMSGMAVDQPVPAGLSDERFAAITADARRYGFHATLKAPFTLNPDQDVDALGAALSDIAAGNQAFPLRLMPALIEGFVALIPAEPSPALDALVARLVVELDHFRAPLSEADLARRRKAGLDAVEDAYLVRYGYPYVFERFKFHMTLSSRLDAGEATTVLDHARHWFRPLLDHPVMIDRLALFVEPSPGAEFVIDRFCSLGFSSREGSHHA